MINDQWNIGTEVSSAFYFIILISFLTIHIAFINIRHIAVPSQYLFIMVFSVRFIVTKSRLSGYTVWSAIYLIISCLSIFYSQNQSVVFSAILNIGQVIVYCNLLLPYLLESDKNFDLFVNGIIIATLVLLVRLVIGTPDYEWGTRRLGSAIGYNPNTIGLYFSFSAILASLYFRKKRVSIYLVCALVLGATSLFSGSKKAFFVMIIGVTLAFGLGKISLRRILYISILLILVPILLYYIVMDWDALYYVLGRRLEPFFAGLSKRNFGENDASRFEMIRVGVGLFAKKPFLGYGVGTYSLVSGFNTYSHNNYIELLVSIGLIGTIVYYSIHVYVLVSSARLSLKTKFNNITYLIPLIVVCIILFIDMGLVNYSNEYFQFLVLLSFACVKK